jgi:hypothetical protein
MGLRSTSQRLRRRHNVNKALDAYVAWRDACLAVQVAHRSWRGRRGAGATLAFYAYEDALEREERAANVYAKLIRALGEVTSVSPPQLRAEMSAGREG